MTMGYIRATEEAFKRQSDSTESHIDTLIDFVRRQGRVFSRMGERLQQPLRAVPNAPAKHPFVIKFRRNPID